MTEHAEQDAGLALARRYIERVWNGADPGAIAELFDGAYIEHAYQPADAHGHAAMVAAFHAAFSDARHEIEHAVADGDMVLLRLRVRARHSGPFRGVAPQGAPIDVRQYRSLRIRAGRIVEHWALFDTATLLRQIGAPGMQQGCAR